MLLSEQKHKRLSRLYYHGQVKGYDSSKRLFNELYLSTKFLYALSYAFDSSNALGEVEVFKLRETANIFNMRCKTDEAALRKQLNSYSPMLTRHIEALKSNDWSFFLNSDNNRVKLVDIIRDLGYDGYFNFEIDSIAVEMLRRSEEFRYDDFDIKSPAIGLFNKDVLMKVYKYDESNIESYPEYEKLRQRELEHIVTSTKIEMLREKDGFDLAAFAKLRFGKCRFFTKNEVLKIASSVRPEDLLTYLYEWRHCLEGHSYRFHCVQLSKEKLDEDYNKSLAWLRKRFSINEEDERNAYESCRNIESFIEVLR